MAAAGYFLPLCLAVPCKSWNCSRYVIVSFLHVMAEYCLLELAVYHAQRNRPAQSDY
jgi:hypothetical protein